MPPYMTVIEVCSALRSTQLAVIRSWPTGCSKCNFLISISMEHTHARNIVSFGLEAVGIIFRDLALFRPSHRNRAVNLRVNLLNRPAVKPIPNFLEGRHIAGQPFLYRRICKALKGESIASIAALNGAHKSVTPRLICF